MSKYFGCGRRTPPEISASPRPRDKGKQKKEKEKKKVGDRKIFCLLWASTFLGFLEIFFSSRSTLFSFCPAHLLHIPL